MLAILGFAQDQVYNLLKQQPGRGFGSSIKKNIMKVIYKGHSLKEVKDSEVLDSVKKALELVEGKNGFKTYSEKWLQCELIISIGHNIYNTSIEIRPFEHIMLERKSKYHNGYAYFCNGAFWANLSQANVELI